ncbi:hypothetical protein AMAG_01395 [Allomyces macrogynus ATCC 38327]|uniref:Uncharacterized protein n=1 Tax=Allomyces macrogynus (strain ATCC 38327) TaxID=578462 RepID=A0A0L0RYQ6_ALLM3|nr:hypothetical protein AMAG_01395 [Allomyces macrogynus ATCC 38327]|eukprot:KNE55507.1 hypothetical protein AMAG_01395 [Allomyces macrogynus ATCC 38327]
MDAAPPPLDALGDARLLDRTLVCPRAFGRLRACLAQEHNHELADFWADFMLLVTLPKYLASWAGPTPTALFPALAPDTAAGALTAPNAADDWRRLASALPPVLAAAAAGIPSLPATPTSPTAPTPENNDAGAPPVGGTEVTAPPARAASLHATSPIHHGEEMALNVRSSWLWPEPRTPRDGGLGAFPPYPPVAVEYAVGGGGDAVGAPLAAYASGEGSSSSSATPPHAASMHTPHHHHHLWSRDRTASSASLGSASFSGSGSNGSAISATVSPPAPSPSSSPAMSSLAKLWRKALTLTTGSSSGGSSPRASPTASPVYDPSDPVHHSHHEHGSGWFGRSPNSRKRRPTTLHVATPATTAGATPPSPPWATMPAARATAATAIRPLPPPATSFAALSDDAAAAAAAARAPAFRPVVLTSPLGAWQPPTTTAASLTNAPPPSPATCAAVARRLRRALVRRASTADNDTDDETLWHDLDALLAVVADEVRRMVRATRAWAMVAADSPQIDDPRYPAVTCEDDVPPPDPASPRRPAWDTLRELGLINGTNGGAVAVAAEPPPPLPHAVHLLAPPPAVARRVSMRVAAVDDAHAGKRAPTTSSPPRTPRDVALSPAAAALVDVDRSMAEVLAASEWGHWRAREPPSPASPSWSL